MFDVTIVKYVVHPGKTGHDLTLMGVAEYLDEACNFSTEFDFTDFDNPDFWDELEDTLAKAFEVERSKVKIPKDGIKRKMEYWYNKFKEVAEISPALFN